MPRLGREADSAERPRLGVAARALSGEPWLRGLACVHADYENDRLVIRFAAGITFAPKLYRGWLVKLERDS